MANENNTVRDIGMAIGGGAVDQLTQQLFLERNLKAQKRMADYNQHLALEMWDKTNYAAQRRQMEKAGLNVGLMYKGAGEGGRTAGAGTGNLAPSTSTPGIGIEMGLQIQKNKAEIDLLRAEKGKTNAEEDALRQPKEGTIAKATLENILQTTKNESVKNAILEAQKEQEEINARIATITEAEHVNMILKQSKILSGIMDQELAAGRLSQEEYDTTVKAYRLAAVELDTKIKVMKSGIAKNKVEMDKMNKEITQISAAIENMTIEQQQEWTRLSQQDRETKVKEMLGAFATSNAAHIKQWTEVVNDGINGLSKIQEMLQSPGLKAIKGFTGNK